MMNIQNPYQNQQIQPQQFPTEQQEHLKCPRCDSNNTKFCYYNNYNLSQPRHYCKNCRRYWTKGGALRNIPIGGGSRKNTKRSSNPSKKSSVSVPVSTISQNSGFKPEPSSVNGAPFENDHDQCSTIDVNGSFCSLLAGFNSSGSGIRRMPFGDFSESLSSGSGLELDMGRNPVLDLERGNHSESLLGKYGGDSSCWNGGGNNGGGDGNGWPDLAI